MPMQGGGMEIIMFIKQISVFMENRPGRLAEITQVISDNNISMRAINIADTTDFGILRMIVDDFEKAEKVLRENNMTASVSDVIAVSFEDKVGSFNKVVSLLSSENLSVEYIYSFIGEKSAKAVIVIKTNDGELAASLLKKGGVEILSMDDIKNF